MIMLFFYFLFICCIFVYLVIVFIIIPSYFLFFLSFNFVSAVFLVVEFKNYKYNNNIPYFLCFLILIF